MALSPEGFLEVAPVLHRAWGPRAWASVGCRLPAAAFLLLCGVSGTLLQGQRPAQPLEALFLVMARDREGRRQRRRSERFSGDAGERRRAHSAPAPQRQGEMRDKARVTPKPGPDCGAGAWLSAGRSPAFLLCH